MADRLADGRYVYCVVRATGDPPDRLDVEGIDGRLPRTVRAGAVAAVVHETDELYDSDDLATLRRWLLAHHRVVEAATERFGTPVPFQFDVVLEGGDRTVRDWLDDAGPALEEALAAVAGRREYRIELSLEPDAPVPDPEGELDALADRVAAASDGQAFLLEKKLERRRRELARERAGALATRLREAVADVVVDSTPAGGDRLGIGRDDGDRERVTALAVLAPHDREAELGRRLDPIADEPGVAVRFTGPWAPYSFVPSFEWGAR